MEVKESDITTIIGVDPGVTTGLCICRVSPDQDSPGEYVVSVEGFIETSLLDIFEHMDTAISNLDAELVVIESIVHSGYLNKEKVTQIRAHERAVTMADYWGIPVEEVTPQEVKRITCLDSDVKGNHARDAYRVIMAYLVKKNAQNVAKHNAR